MNYLSLLPHNIHENIIKKTNLFDLPFDIQIIKNEWSPDKNNIIFYFIKEVVVLNEIKPYLLDDEIIKMSKKYKTGQFVIYACSKRNNVYVFKYKKNKANAYDKDNLMVFNGNHQIFLENGKSLNLTPNAQSKLLKILNKNFICKNPNCNLVDSYDYIYVDKRCCICRHLLQELHTSCMLIPKCSSSYVCENCVINCSKCDELCLKTCKFQCAICQKSGLCHNCTKG